MPLSVSSLHRTSISPLLRVFVLVCARKFKRFIQTNAPPLLPPGPLSVTVASYTRGCRSSSKRGVSRGSSCRPGPTRTGESAIPAAAGPRRPRARRFEGDQGLGASIAGPAGPAAGRTAGSPSKSDPADSDGLLRGGTLASAPPASGQTAGERLRLGLGPGGSGAKADKLKFEIASPSTLDPGRAPPSPPLPGASTAAAAW